MPALHNLLSDQRFIAQRFFIFPGRHIYPDKKDDEDDEYYEICSNQIDASMKNFFSKMAMIFISLIMALIWPTYKFVSQGVKTTATQVKFPFINENSNDEFIGNLLLQSVLFGHGFAAYIGLEVGMDIIAGFVTVSRKLLQYRLRKLDDQREQKPLKDVKILFTNAIQQIRAYDKYELVPLNSKDFLNSIIRS